MTCVAQSLLSRASVVLLDEPTAGMDCATRRLVRRRLNEQVSRGRTLLLSTHDIDDCAQMCTRLGVMSGGALTCVGTVPELRQRYVSASCEHTCAGENFSGRRLKSKIFKGRSEIVFETKCSSDWRNFIDVILNTHQKHNFSCACSSIFPFPQFSHTQHPPNWLCKSVNMWVNDP